MYEYVYIYIHIWCIYVCIIYIYIDISYIYIYRYHHIYGYITYIYMRYIYIYISIMYYIYRYTYIYYIYNIYIYKPIHFWNLTSPFLRILAATCGSIFFSAGRDRWHGAGCTHMGLQGLQRPGSAKGAWGKDMKTRSRTSYVWWMATNVFDQLFTN